VKYVFPDQDIVLQTHHRAGISKKESASTFYHEEFSRFHNALVLRKLKMEGKLCKKITEHIFEDIYTEENNVEDKC